MNSELSLDDVAFVAYLLRSTERRAYVRDKLGDVPLFPSPLVHVLSAIFNTGASDIAERLTSSNAESLYAAALVYPCDDEPEKIDEIIHKRIVWLKHQWLRAENDRIHKEIEEASRMRDIDKAKVLLAQMVEIFRQTVMP